MPSQFLDKVYSKYKVQAVSHGPAVYVGTYGKYNEGSIKGKWLYLDNYDSYEAFMDAALKLHSDEADPELMFQDFEGFPKRYYNESSIDKDLWDWLALDEDDRELLEIYIDQVSDEKATIEQAKDAFIGKYKSKEDWAIQNTGDLSEEELSSYLMISGLDAHLLASDMVSGRADDLRDELSKENYAGVFKDTGLYQDEYEELQEKLDAEDDEAKQKAIQKEIEKLADKSIEEWESDEIDTVERELKKDPVGYLVDDQGLYSIEDLAKQDFMQINYEAYARDAELGGDVDFVETHHDEVWVFNRR